ncbi:hypothetical protein TREES_T100020209 [Tupaia chinensis]|uniref:Uncharacterized protein n=1 Tax=Tupaia chinensis TaxID=246437 RepID=L9LBP9_TUPCH|nr:hypothetical protein TREES_T100020209 [Tupaia chinensis]
MQTALWSSRVRREIVDAGCLTRVRLHGLGKDRAVRAPFHETEFTPLSSPPTAVRGAETFRKPRVWYACQLLLGWDTRECNAACPSLVLTEDRGERSTCQISDTVGTGQDLEVWAGPPWLGHPLWVSLLAWVPPPAGSGGSPVARWRRVTQGG